MQLTHYLTVCSQEDAEVLEKQLHALVPDAVRIKVLPFMMDKQRKNYPADAKVGLDVFTTLQTVSNKLCMPCQHHGLTSTRCGHALRMCYALCHPQHTGIVSLFTHA